MRVTIPGIRRSRATFRFFFADEEITAHPGESIASALLAAGIYGLRETRAGDLRGVFCGMGVCGECQVLVDGESRRACMEAARPDLRVNRHPAHYRPLETSPLQQHQGWSQQSPDVLVVGAGPAGLSAARVTANAGLDVLVVDERRRPGGQFFKQPASGFEVAEEFLDSQFTAGRRLIHDAEASGARFSFGTTAWGVFDGYRIAATTADTNLLISAKRIVLSPGAYERALPVPGWTLPGVMTTGAAQTLLRAYQTAPGQRVLIAGNGPLNLQVADELCRSGVEVAAVAELAAAPWRGALSSALSMTLASPSLALAGVRHLSRLARRRVPVHYQHVLISVDGKEKVSHASIAAVDSVGNIISGTEQRFEVDAVCLNYGFLPQSELPRALGCKFDYDLATGMLSARRSDDGRTNVAEVFIAGDAGGLGGAKVAADQGQLAGLAVINDLLPSSGAGTAAARTRRRLRRNADFQHALWRVFRGPTVNLQLAESETPICRCEDIQRWDFDQLLRRKHAGLAAIKKATRAGMGRCQGRYCMTLITALAVEHGHAPARAGDFFAPRPPAKPLAIGRLCEPCGNPLQAADVNSTTGRTANK